MRSHLNKSVKLLLFARNKNISSTWETQPKFHARVRAEMRQKRQVATVSSLCKALSVTPFWFLTKCRSHPRMPLHPRTDSFCLPVIWDPLPNWSLSPPLCVFPSLVQTPFCSLPASECLFGLCLWVIRALCFRSYNISANTMSFRTWCLQDHCWKWQDFILIGERSNAPSKINK